MLTSTAPKSILNIKIGSANNLCYENDMEGYVLVRFMYRCIMYNTSYQNKAISPTWNHSFQLPFTRGADLNYLRFEIFECDVLKTKFIFMGHVDIDLNSLQYNLPSDGFYRIDNPNRNVNLGNITIKLYLQTDILNYPEYQNPIHNKLPQDNTIRPGNIVNELFAIFPQVSRLRIEELLNKHNGDKELTLAELLDTELENCSHKPNINDSSNNAPVLGNNNQTVQQNFTDIQNQQIQMNRSHHQYGYVPACSMQFTNLNAPVYQSGGRRKSLLIGINYPNSPQKLNGCHLDVQRIRHLLISYYGFPSFSNSMVCLTSESTDWRYKPTKQNILYAMKWLVSDARPGDVFFFLFSGHGSQIPNKDGTEADGYDEVILPEDYDTKGLIIDDDMHAIMVRPLPSGARLTGILDCCHGGTGFDLPYIWDPKLFNWKEDFCPFYSPGDVQLISGSRDNEVAADVSGSNLFQGGGALTTAFISAVTCNTHGHSYPSLLQHITKALINRGIYNQIPQLSSTQKFSFDRRFNLTDIVPNRNPQLGRKAKKVKPLSFLNNQNKPNFFSLRLF